MDPVTVHYPTEPKKYTGSLWTVKGKQGETFCVKIMNADVRYQKNFKTLAVASRRTQNINKTIHKNNISGVKGVYDKQTDNSWVASWQDGIAQKKSKYFSVAKYGQAQAKEMAIIHQRLMTETLPHYILAYGHV